MPLPAGPQLQGRGELSCSWAWSRAGTHSGPVHRLGVRLGNSSSIKGPWEGPGEAVEARRQESWRLKLGPADLSLKFF